MKVVKTSLILFFVGALSYSFIAKKHDGHDHGLHIGDKAPKTDLEMANIDDTKMTLNSAKGSNGLLVVFSCNTCPFVVGSDAFPGWERQYNTIFEEAKANGINMVLVNSNEGKRENEDSMEEMKKRANQQKYLMPYLVDKNSELANAFGAKTTPHVYLFDAEMKLIYMGAIDNTYDPKRKTDESYLRNVFTNLKAKENVKVSSTTPRGCTIKRVLN